MSDLQLVTAATLNKISFRGIKTQTQTSVILDESSPLLKSSASSNQEIRFTSRICFGPLYFPTCYKHRALNIRFWKCYRSIWMLTHIRLKLVALEVNSLTNWSDRLMQIYWLTWVAWRLVLHPTERKQNSPIIEDWQLAVAKVEIRAVGIQLAGGESCPNGQKRVFGENV